MQLGGAWGVLEPSKSQNPLALIQARPVKSFAMKGQLRLRGMNRECRLVRSADSHSRSSSGVCDPSARFGSEQQDPVERHKRERNEAIFRARRRHAGGELSAVVQRVRYKTVQHRISLSLWACLLSLTGETVLWLRCTRWPEAPRSRAWRCSFPTMPALSRERSTTKRGRLAGAWRMVLLGFAGAKCGYRCPAYFLLQQLDEGSRGIRSAGDLKLPKNATLPDGRSNNPRAWGPTRTARRVGGHRTRRFSLHCRP